MKLSYDTLCSTEAKVDDVLKKVLDSEDVIKFNSEGFRYISHHVVTYGMHFGLDLKKNGLWMLRLIFEREDG